ncbi:MAG: 50S ribosomal protein L20 [Peptococcaceae bacterium]|nr:50S ribosomal protein L20 [Peptococcaceae bacterium]MDR2736667.1 50S ribosomal protein L20 [Gracilibacteraceae bacterium]
MARVKRGMAAHRRHKKVFKLARGFRGRTGFKVAKQWVVRSMAFSTAHRKMKKRDFRRLWIARINAAARLNGMSYNRFMYGLKLAQVDVNRKIMADMAINDPAAFAALVDLAKDKVEAQTATTANA